MLKGKIDQIDRVIHLDKPVGREPRNQRDGFVGGLEAGLILSLGKVEPLLPAAAKEVTP